jgi:hypothetical protein
MAAVFGSSEDGSQSGTQPTPGFASAARAGRRRGKGSGTWCHCFAPRPQLTVVEAWDVRLPTPLGQLRLLGWCGERQRRPGACDVLFGRFSVRRGATERHTSETGTMIASAVWRRWSWVALRVGGSCFVVGLRCAEVLASKRPISTLDHLGGSVVAEASYRQPAATTGVNVLWAESAVFRG